MADAKPRKARRRRSPFAITLLVLALLTAVVAGGLVYAGSRYVRDLPTLDAIKAREIGANSSVYDAQGNSLGVLANEENRQPVTSSQISPWMKKGTVATTATAASTGAASPAPWSRTPWRVASSRADRR
jgi:membrane peptidoglycan carboxypeptidase